MKDLFLSVVEISLSTSVIILGLLIFSQLLNKRYLTKWKYFIWIALALRLALPVKLELPQKEIVFEVPARVAAPIVSDAAVTAIPFVPQVPQAPAVSALDIIAGVWLAGCILFVLVHLGSYVVYRRQVMVAGAQVRDREMLRLVRGLSRELGISGPIPVRTYRGASSPMVLGFFRPILVLPDMDFRQEELGFVLRHELTHLKRHDIFVKLLFILANALHWFNPVVYMMRRAAVVDMELSCDESVVQGRGYDDRKAYTETLLATLCRQQRRSTNLSTQFYGGKEVMKLRFVNILSRAKKKNGVLLLAVVVAAALALGMVMGVDADDELPQLQAAEPTAEPSQPTQEVSRGGDVQTVVDIKEVQAMVGTADQFTRAYLSRDTSAMEPFFAYSYMEAEAYQGPDIELGDLSGQINFAPTPYDLSVNQADEVSVYSEDIPLYSRITMAVDIPDGPAGLERFVVALTKMEEGWKVCEYGFARRGLTATEEDSRQIAKLVEDFSAAYFAGDDKALEAYVLQPRDQFSSGAYTGRLLEIHGFKGLPRAGDSLPDGQVPVSVEFLEEESPDSYTYLSMELAKQGTEWKVYSYGLEK